MDNGILDQTYPEPCGGSRILATISPSGVYRILNKSNIKPFRIQYYCERRGPDFESKMHNVLLVYKQLSMQLDKNDQLLPFDKGDEIVYVLSYDEKYVKAFVSLIDGKYSKTIVYGHGVVGRNVLAQIKQYESLSVECILVTKRENGWLSVDGVPIIETHDSEAIDRNIPVLISTISKYHSAIEQTLREYGYTNIYFLGGGMLRYEDYSIGKWIFKR